MIINPVILLLIKDRSNYSLISYKWVSFCATGTLNGLDFVERGSQPLKRNYHFNKEEEENVGIK